MKVFNEKVITIFLVLFQFSLWGHSSLQGTSVYWSKGKFCERDKEHLSPKAKIVTDQTIYVELNCIECYGHALLDGLLPLYAMMKQENLLDKPVNLAIRVHSDQMTNPTARNILQLIKDVFPFKEIMVLQGRKKFYFDNLILNDFKDKYSGFYKTFPDSHKYTKQLKDFGIQDNIVFRDAQTTDNITKEFVKFITSAYKINPEMIKNRVLITQRNFNKEISNLGDLINYLLPNRTPNRRISNLKELVHHLKTKGYDVEVVDFERLSIKEQIIHTMQAHYVMGTYGSNLVNTIFLHPEANVVILWHKYAKYFWSRKYCIIHSAFLSMGVKLIEFDKPDYDLRDIYIKKISDPEFFYRKGSRIFLRPEKASLEEMIKYPLPAMYDLTNVNLYIQPAEIVQLLEKAKFLNNEPCKLVR